MDTADRIALQIEFVAMTDRLKSISRRTRPIGESRFESSAEHSWQVALMAILLVEHANEPVDLLRVVRMLLIHDVVEIEVGDTFHYAKAADPTLADREDRAAQRLFGTLPDSQAAEFLALWREFEARESPEARYAAAVDRTVAFVLNSRNGGGTWAEHDVPFSLIRDRNAHAAEGSQALWDHALGLAKEFAPRD